MMLPMHHEVLSNSDWPNVGLGIRLEEGSSVPKKKNTKKNSGLLR